MPFTISANSKKDPIAARGDTFGGEVEFNLNASRDKFPLDVVFCIDKSGSMSGGDIRTARKGLAHATRELGTDDRFGVVAFDSSTEDVVTSASGSSASRYESRIKNISAGGGTDIMAGLSNAKRQLQSMRSRESVQWIVLITDGGSSVSDRILEQEYGESGITVYTAGIGNFNQTVIKTVAEQTQGEWEDVGQASALQEFFKRKVNEARGVVALNPELELRPEPDTDINDVQYTFGNQQSMVEPEWRRGNCVLALSDLNAEKVPKVVFEVEADKPAGDDVKIIEAELRTAQRTVSDEMLVEVAPPFMAEEDSGRGEVHVGKAMELAEERNEQAAKSYIEKHEDEMDPVHVAEVKDALDADEEERSHVLGTLDEED